MRKISSCRGFLCYSHLFSTESQPHFSTSDINTLLTAVIFIPHDVMWKKKAELEPLITACSNMTLSKHISYLISRKCRISANSDVNQTQPTMQQQKWKEEKSTSPLQFSENDEFTAESTARKDENHMNIAKILTNLTRQWRTQCSKKQ